MTAELPATLLDDLAPLRRARGVLLVGEIHGTEQFPRLLAGLAAAAATEGLAVTVGLEIPCSEQDRIDELLDADDRPITGSWWERAPEFQDGRSSRAMAGLVGSLAGLRRQGADLAVVALDGPWVAPGSRVPLELLDSLEQDRDEGMAMRLLDRMDRRPSAFTVVLAGNEHTRVEPRAAGGAGRLRDRAAGPPSRTMGAFVNAWHRDLVSLIGRWSGGTAWLLTEGQSTGAVHEITDAELPPGAQWTDAAGDDGHHGYVHVGPLTASAPHWDWQNRNQGMTPSAFKRSM